MSLKEKEIIKNYIVKHSNNQAKNGTQTIQITKKFRTKWFSISKIILSGTVINFQTFYWKLQNQCATHLRFVDDIVLFAKTSEDMERMINELAKESKIVSKFRNPKKKQEWWQIKKKQCKHRKNKNWIYDWIKIGQRHQKTSKRKKVK